MQLIRKLAFSIDREENVETLVAVDGQMRRVLCRYGHDINQIPDQKRVSR